ncbi:uncharacterized protein LOC144102265 [Amblyomma americanum]
MRGTGNLPLSGDVPFDATSTPQDVTAIQLRLPSFWSKNPQVWFAQVEAIFNLRRVNSETSRFYHLLSNLSPEVAHGVADVLAEPLGDTPYQRIKKRILERTTASERTRLQQLLTREELGDRRPSQLLTSMRKLLGQSNVDSNGAVLRELFLQRLPQSIRLVLAAVGDVTLDRLAELADRMHDEASPSDFPRGAVAAICAMPQTSAMSQLEARIDQLAASVDALRTSSNGQRGPYPCPCRHSCSPSGNHSCSPGSSTLCWYHRMFQNRARKCTSPCGWSGNVTQDH